MEYYGDELLEDGTPLPFHEQTFDVKALASSKTQIMTYHWRTVGEEADMQFLYSDVSIHAID